MKIEFTPKAKKLINTFTKRERETANYILRLIGERYDDMLKMQNNIDAGCDVVESSAKYRELYASARFTMNYILDCLDLNTSTDDYLTLKVDVTKSFIRYQKSLKK